VDAIEISVAAASGAPAGAATCAAPVRRTATGEPTAAGTDPGYINLEVILYPKAILPRRLP